MLTGGALLFVSNGQLADESDSPGEALSQYRLKQYILVVKEKHDECDCVCFSMLWLGFDIPQLNLGCDRMARQPQWWGAARVPRNPGQIYDNAYRDLKVVNFLEFEKACDETTTKMVKSYL